jgi:hypothetical protein
VWNGENYVTRDFVVYVYSSSGTVMTVALVLDGHKVKIILIAKPFGNHMEDLEGDYTYFPTRTGRRVWTEDAV